MATRKVFDVATVDSGDVIPFDIVFHRSPSDADPDRELTKTIEFKAYAEPPGGAVMIITKMARVTKAGEAVIDASGMTEFMTFALLPESATQWEAMIADREWMIPGRVLGEVYEFLQEEWSGRPTKRSPSSSGGRPTTSHSSTERVSSTE